MGKRLAPAIINDHLLRVVDVWINQKPRLSLGVGSATMKLLVHLTWQLYHSGVLFSTLLYFRLRMNICERFQL